jgi:hypothetical protein
MRVGTTNFRSLGFRKSGTKLLHQNVQAESHAPTALAAICITAYSTLTHGSSRRYNWHGRRQPERNR